MEKPLLQKSGSTSFGGVSLAERASPYMFGARNKKTRPIGLWLKNGVTPKWVPLKDQSLRSDPWVISFPIHPPAGRREPGGFR